MYRKFKISSNPDIFGAESQGHQDHCLNLRIPCWPRWYFLLPQWPVSEECSHPGVFHIGQPRIAPYHFFLNVAKKCVLGWSLRNFSSSFILELGYQNPLCLELGLACIFYPKKQMCLPQRLFYHVSRRVDCLYD